MTEQKRAGSLALMSLVLCVAAGAAAAQTQRTAHTYALDNPDERPAATFDDVAWLVGSWEGEAFGGHFEEVWNPPSAGSMVGMFKTLDDDTVGFYELLLLVAEQGSLSLKVKHFSRDFVAWEDKEDFVDFRFIRADADAIHFSGISFYRISDDEMHGYVAMRGKDEIYEEKLVYRRRR